MIESKHINKIIIFLLIGVVVFTGTLLVVPRTIGIESTETKEKYVDKLFNKEEIASINISVDEKKWAEMLENAMAEEFISCDITINNELFESVGIRPKGNSSLTMVAQSEDTDRFSFKIKFDKYVSGQTYYGLKEIVINNMQGDATYMKEYLSYDLFDYMGVDTPLYAFSDISLNGEAWGFYLAVETIEEEFAQRTYGTDHGEIYKPESQDIGFAGKNMPDGNTTGAIQRPEGMTDGSIQRLEGMTGGSIQRPEGMTSGGVQLGDRRQGGMPDNDTGKGADLVYSDNRIDSYNQIFDNAVFKASDADKNKVIKAIKALSTGDELEKYVETDEVLRYFAVNTALVNLDSYVCNFKHNYYLYEEDGKLSILPWDLNLSFAGFQSTSGTDAVNFPIDTPVVAGIALAERPLIGNLLKNEVYNSDYHKYLLKIVEEYFNSGIFEEKINKLDAMIKDHVKNDPTAFYTVDEYTKAINTLKTFGNLRAESIQGQLNGTVPATLESQALEPKKLIDASDMNLSDMGSQGMGRDSEDQMPGQKMQ